jgi:hypothetical protein
MSSALPTEREKHWRRRRSVSDNRDRVRDVGVGAALRSRPLSSRYKASEETAQGGCAERLWKPQGAISAAFAEPSGGLQSPTSRATRRIVSSGVVSVVVGGHMPAHVKRDALACSQRPFGRNVTRDSRDVAEELLSAFPDDAAVPLVVPPERDRSRDGMRADATTTHRRAS